MAYHIQNPFVISFSKIYHIIGVIGFPFICLCICICLCIFLCICISVRVWVADIISFHKIYGLRGNWGLRAVLQLIHELRKNCCGTGGRVDGTSKVLQKVFADYTLARVGKKWKIHPPQLFASLGPRVCPRAIFRASGCKLPQGVYFYRAGVHWIYILSILPSYLRCNFQSLEKRMAIHCLESGWTGKSPPLGNLHPSALEIASGGVFSNTSLLSAVY